VKNPVTATALEQYRTVW